MINVKDEPRPDPVDDLPWGNSSSFFSEKASAPVFSAVAMWCLRAPAELPMMGEVKEGNKSKVTFGMSELRRGLLGFVKQCCHRVATKNRKSSFKKSQNSQRIFLLHKLFLRLVFSVLFLILFCTFWGFLLNKFLKVKIRNKFASRKGAFLSRNQTLKFARIAKIRKVWQHWEGRKLFPFLPPAFPHPVLLAPKVCPPPPRLMSQNSSSPRGYFSGAPQKPVHQ